VFLRLSARAISARVPVLCDSWRVEGAADSAGAVAQDVGVDHCDRNVPVAQQLLYRPDVVPALEEVGGEGVPEAVTGGSFGDPGGKRRSADRALHGGFVKVMPTLPALRGPATASSREKPNATANAWALTVTCGRSRPATTSLPIRAQGPPGGPARSQFEWLGTQRRVRGTRFEWSGTQRRVRGTRFEWSGTQRRVRGTRFEWSGTQRQSRGTQR